MCAEQASVSGGTLECETFRIVLHFLFSRKRGLVLEQKQFRKDGSLEFAQLHTSALPTVEAPIVPRRRVHRKSQNY